MRKLFTGFLVAIILLGGDLIWRAWAQTNTFCANNLACTVTGAWGFAQQITSSVSTGTAPFSIASTTVVPNLNAQLHNGLTAPGSAIVGISDTQALTNKTFDISANTLKNSTNTAGHVPRNNGTQYVDGQLACGDLSNATGGCSTALQGSDTKLLTAGTVSGTGAALCTDANGGASTSSCTAGGVTESVISTGNGAQSTNLVCAAANQASGCQWWFWANAHTITRLIINVSTAPSGCSPNAVFGVKDVTSSTVLASLTPTATGITDSGVLSVSTTAGHQFVIGLTTATAGCTTTIVANSMGVTYQ